MIRLYDTAAASVLPLDPKEPGRVSMYVCGPTVYGPPHLGHGRFSLVFDVLRRYLIWSGLDVTYVSNITDIDDKIIQRSADEGRPWQNITEEYERVWFEAMDAINVLRDAVLALPAPGPDAARLMQDRGGARLVRGSEGLA